MQGGAALDDVLPYLRPAAYEGDSIDSRVSGIPQGNERAITENGTEALSSSTSDTSVAKETGAESTDAEPQNPSSPPSPQVEENVLTDDEAALAMIDAVAEHHAYEKMRPGLQDEVICKIEVLSE